MTHSLSHSLTADEAIALLQIGQPISSCYISGALELPPGENWDQEIFLENCVVEKFSCLSISFSKAVRLGSCRFRECQFTFSYFLHGLSVDTCVFDSYLDFQAGGHNQASEPIRFVNNHFAGFVNFFDCQYESGVTITDNHFLGGTNLLGKPYNIPVTFAVAPLLARNSGQLDADDEGPTHVLNG